MSKWKCDACAEAEGGSGMPCILESEMILPGTELLCPITGLTADFFEVKECTACFCTDVDCSQCIEAQGHPCHWVAPGKCSRCFDENGELRKKGKAPEKQEKPIHTPIPWVAEYKGGSHYTKIRSEDYGIIAEVETHVCTDDGYVLAGEEFEANAHLIAAAPDLLEACEAAVMLCVNEQGPIHRAAVCEFLDKAITKATGE